ncbi:hypothetical protein GOP47_0006696 [Adiantum capillus-veneris]|uniref:F-box domain-containing protein n=1 Tax=Adiantum capillus-veneris TaxID=13818 RepID=A0A9D4V3X6_ADICA|nr:hypothetical protein GOP47_0006696 [Adiantum capillus-veneris]
MEAEGAGGGGGGGDETLIPGLPEQVVIFHVLTRLPWYARPVCRTISKHWRASIDTLTTRPFLAAETRKHQLPLLKGLFLIWTTVDTQLFLERDYTEDGKRKATFHTVWKGMIHSHWRELPPLQGLREMYNLQLRANYGILYVWSSQDPNVVVKMDLSRGDWTWSIHRVLHPFDELNAIFKGKIFVPLVNAAGSQTERQKSFLSYDMITGQCKLLLQTDNFPHLRVLLTTSSVQSASHVEEELYGLVELESVFVVQVFDAGRQSWRKIEEVPFPDDWKLHSDLSEVSLLNGDCFEPVAEMDNNIVWWDGENSYVSWFNPLHKTWSLDDGEYSERNVMNQGICKDEEDHCVEGEENNGIEAFIEVVARHQVPILHKQAVAESILKWKTVLAVGHFEKDAFVPVWNCTIIA